MASSKLNRYISVIKAKGAQLDPLAMAKMLREDAASGRPYSPQTTADVAPAPAESIRKKRQELINTDEGGISGDPATPSSLSEAIGGQMGRGAATGLVAKGGISAALTAATAPSVVSPIDAAIIGASSAMTAPVSLGIAVNNMAGSSISGAIIGANVTDAFGEQAAQEAADVMSGQSALSSISTKGQNAYANAKVAMETAPKTVSKHLTNLVRGKEISSTPISTVTPHHTPEAISEAFDVSGGGYGADQFGGTMQGLHDALDASGLSGGGGVDSGGSSIGQGGGSDGQIGPGNY